MGFKVNRTGGMVVGAHNIGGDIPPSGTINITENGTYDVGQYASANVQTPVPTGKINITENGTDINVSDYALADVDVAGGISVDEDYTVSEGKLTSTSFELIGDVVATIPDGVVKIGASAFSNNALISKVIMPNSVTTIEDGAPWGSASGAFNGCTNLKDIEFSNNLTYIADYSFANCRNITNVIIPDSVTSIGDYAFNSCSRLSSLIIGDSVTSIDNSAFSNCASLTLITIPNTVTSIGDSLFNGCTGLTSITISNNVTSIGAYTFAGCTSLTSITIPVSVTSLGNFACIGCTRLTSIIIPDSITSIGNNAFKECTSLTDIYYTGTQAEWEQITIGSDAIPQGVTVHYEYTPS